MLMRPFRICAITILAIALPFGLNRHVAAAQEPAAPLTVGDYLVVGPTTHKNLSLFVVRGEDKIKAGKFLTLEEAMAKKTLVVRETGNVNRLTVENKGELPVYIQGGEIVRGGQQDRALEHDTVVPPKSGQIAVSAYCVESGRWSARRGDPVSVFASSTQMLSTKKGKLAARVQKNQGAVWDSVAGTQANLASKVGAPVQNVASPTSLELSLEDKRVQDAVAGYMQVLSPLAESASDSVGFGFAINGQMSSVEIFASHALFVKAWGKLLRAATVEAVSEYDDKKAYSAVAAQDVQALIIDAERGVTTVEQITPRVKATKKETKDSVVITSEDAEQNNAPMRKTYLKK